MALDIKNIIADALLSLCETIPLASMRISDILNESRVSRQTFYNHFRDKNDLIQWIYQEKLLYMWTHLEATSDYHFNMISYFKQIEKYHRFMTQACQITDQNCLRDFMLDYGKNYWIRWFKQKLHQESLPDNLLFAISYIANGSTSMIVEWIVNNMPISPESIAVEICNLRLYILSPYFIRYCPDFYIADQEEKSVLSALYRNHPPVSRFPLFWKRSRPFFVSITQNGPPQLAARFIYAVSQFYKPLYGLAERIDIYEKVPL